MQYNQFETFLNSIRAGKLCVGCCITFTDPAVTEIAAEAGFDFCWIDGEHGVLDRATAMQHIMALKGTGCAPFYRVPACDHTEIKRVIDFAPAGIIVPMVMVSLGLRRLTSVWPDQSVKPSGLTLRVMLRVSVSWLLSTMMAPSFWPFP